jgi:hypothetical protein
LDHATGKQGWLGPAHRRCNRRAGGKKGAAVANAKRKRRSWLSPALEPEPDGQPRKLRTSREW